MGYYEKAVTAAPGWTARLGVENLKQLLGPSLLTIALIGCGSPASRDVLAYDACVTRHPQEIALCEGPRQAYELDPIAFQARATAASPPADSGDAWRLAVAQPTLTPLRPRPNPIASGRKG